MTNLELKAMLRVLQAEVTDLRNRVGALEAKLTPPKTEPVAIVPVIEYVSFAEPEVKKTDRKMCPHCGVKPNHFFHVKTCQKKNKNNGANEEANG